VAIQASPKASNEFVITVKKGLKKSQQMTFSCDFRPELLTEALVSWVT
jgi:hypothetical protein